MAVRKVLGRRWRRTLRALLEAPRPNKWDGFGRRIEMTIALKPARQHDYRLSAYERRANDFYPTPSDLAISLALGLPRLGLDLPRIALDPCGGDGALRRGLA